MSMGFRLITVVWFAGVGSRDSQGLIPSQLFGIPPSSKDCGRAGVPSGEPI